MIKTSAITGAEKIKKADSEYTITIHLSESSMSSVMPVVITFDNESKCNETFKKIIQEMYGFDYAIVNVK